MTKATQGTLVEDVQMALLCEVVKLCRRHHGQTSARPTPMACQVMEGSGEVEAQQHEAARHPGEFTQHTHALVIAQTVMQETNAESAIKRGVGKG